MDRTVILVLHVAAGVTGLAIGPVALVRALRTHRATWPDTTYHVAMAAVCATAVGLTVFNWSGLWFFVPIALVSYLFVIHGRRAVGAADPRWYRRVLRGYGGAWIALWTAVLVVSAADWPITWFVPTAVGATAIEWFALRPRPAWVDRVSAS
jgi:hypothetical protein